jgi:pimeloyl-ACP methyl ester carboxylesterase
MLHGGAGPRSLTGFAAEMSQHAYVVLPTHPGVDGTPRPQWADTVADLATVYLDLLDQLDLHDVMVVGSSVGGWIAAEAALRDNQRRISCLTLLGTVGVAPDPALRLADPAEIGPVKTGELAFHNPQLRPDPAAFSEEQKAAMAANQHLCRLQRRALLQRSETSRPPAPRHHSGPGAGGRERRHRPPGIPARHGGRLPPRHVPGHRAGWSLPAHRAGASRVRRHRRLRRNRSHTARSLTRNVTAPRRRDRPPARSSLGPPCAPVI